MRASNECGVAYRRVALLCVAGAIAGCADDGADLRDWVAREKNLPAAALAALPEHKAFESFAYRDQGLRDPFAPSEAERKAAEIAAHSQPDPHVRQKLEAFALDALTMVGTVGSGTSMQALVRAPDATIERIGLHGYLGQSGGRVAAIRADRIDLVEWVADDDGTWMRRPAALQLPSAGTGETK